jgi:hypothetical protein
MLRAVHATLACLVVASLAASPVQAGPLEDANAANDEGKLLYAQRDYPGAVAKFRAAWALSRQARYMFNLASVLDDMGRNAEAVEAYQTHLQHPDTRPTDATATWAAKRVVALTPKTGRVHIATGRPEATFALGARTIEGKAGIADALADPGSVVLTVKAGEQSHTTVLEVRAGETIDLDLTPQLAPPAAPTPAPPPETSPSVAPPPTRTAPAPAVERPVPGPGPTRSDRPVLLDPIGFGLASGALVALGVGVYEYSLSRSDVSGLDMAPTLAAHDALLERARDRLSIAQLSFAVSGVLAVGATVRYVLVSRRRPATTIGIRPIASTGGVVTLGGQF